MEFSHFKKRSVASNPNSFLEGRKKRTQQRDKKCNKSRNHRKCCLRTQPRLNNHKTVSRAIFSSFFPLHISHGNIKCHKNLHDYIRQFAVAIGPCTPDALDRMACFPLIANIFLSFPASRVRGPEDVALLPRARSTTP